MSFYFKSIKPGYDAEENDDYTNNTNKLDDILRQDTSDEDSDFQDHDQAEEDGFAKVSFGSLKRAQDDYDTEQRKSKKSKASSKSSNRNADVAQDIKKEMALLKEQRASSKSSKTSSKDHKTYKEESFDEDSESDSDDGQGLFEEEESRFNKNDRMNSNNKNNNNGKKKKSNHAPSEQSSKKRVSLVRDVPGLEINKKYKESSIYQDIRFDKSLGKSEDFNKIRSRYKFLDEYRENEIKELEKMLKDKKFLNKMEDFEINKLHEKLTSMKSKLQTLKNKDLENDIIKNYTNDINSKTKNKFYLKESDKRKIINKYKFDHMKAGQREKIMERKRKKQLGKEMRQFEFNK